MNRGYSRRTTASRCVRALRPPIAGHLVTDLDRPGSLFWVSTACFTNPERRVVTCQSSLNPSGAPTPPHPRAAQGRSHGAVWSTAPFRRPGHKQAGQCVQVDPLVSCPGGLLPNWSDHRHSVVARLLEPGDPCVRVAQPVPFAPSRRTLPQRERAAAVRREQRRCPLMHLDRSLVAPRARSSAAVACCRRCPARPARCGSGSVRLLLGCHQDSFDGRSAWVSAVGAIECGSPPARREELDLQAMPG